MKISDVTSDGTRIVFLESELERVMKRYLTYRHLIDESHRPKRKVGYYIYRTGDDPMNKFPFIMWNFVRWNDAKFVIHLIEKKIPKMKDAGLFIRMHLTTTGKGKDKQKTGLPPTKYEVEPLHNVAREYIWKFYARSG